MAKERVFDEMINFLGDVTFQVPVRTFMDENCISELHDLSHSCHWFDKESSSLFIKYRKSLCIGSPTLNIYIGRWVPNA